MTSCVHIIITLSLGVNKRAKKVDEPCMYMYVCTCRCILELIIFTSCSYTYIQRHVNTTKYGSHVETYGYFTYTLYITAAEKQYTLVLYSCTDFVSMLLQASDILLFVSIVLAGFRPPALVTHTHIITYM